MHPPPSAGREGGTGRRAVAIAALILSALAAWRIARTVVVPEAPPTIAALMAGADAGNPAAPEGRPPAPDAAAVARAQAVLRAEPLAADAYVVLALAAERVGAGEQAARLMGIAAAWWPRGLQAQTWLMARSLRRGDYPTALEHLDTIARARPDVLENLTAALAPVLLDPAAVAALADLLRAEPPWRSVFLAVAVRRWRASGGFVGLMDHLQARPPGLSEAELRPYLNGLVASGSVDRAYLAWLRSLSAERRAGLAYLYNGRFRYPVSDMPFDWTIPAVPGATASVGGTGDDRVLTVGFLGGRVPLQPLRHGLVLAPGAFRLTGRVRTDRLRAERGVRWRIACLEKPDDALAASEPLVGTTAWRDFALEFTVPETECRTQALGLEIYARTAAEQVASGVVSFSALDIQPR